MFHELLTDEILAAAPVTEPERQHYFIGKLRDYIQMQAGAGSDSSEHMQAGAHRSLTAAVVTFGCQMNARDSEKLEGILSEIGYTITQDEQAADLVAFNTCTVRENANEHLYGRLGRLKQSKKANPDKIISVCGCMMQEADEIEKLKVKYPYVDIIFGTHNLYTFPELLFMLFRKRQHAADEIYTAGKEVLRTSSDDRERMEKLLRYGSGPSNLKDIEKLSRRPVISVWKDCGDIVEKLPSRRKYSFKQGINIMFGCNNFCSYCIVPYVRGREKSRKPEEILEEIRMAAADGVKEIMLLGQNVNSYAGGLNFAGLLKQVDELCDGIGIERIRFMTSHPKDLSDELIETMANARHVCRQFHLPLQSGSSRILQRMNRHYDKARFLDRAARLKAAMPDISLSTDIIVGFPGETEEDFLETLDVLKEVRFDSAYTFIYSKREGTPAASYEDQVPEDVVKDRFDRLLEVQNRIVDENLDRLTGACLPVLFEEISEYDKDLITGKLENGITVHVPADPSVIGTIRKVRLTENHRFYYTGEL